MANYKSRLVEFETFLNGFISVQFDKKQIEKMHYMLDGGKRLRPILASAFCCNRSNWDLLAIVEIIHNTSLILDDTPQMDNDNSRRDIPAFHMKYGCKTTYLFAYYLLGWVGKYLSRKFKNPASKYDSHYLAISSSYDELLSLVQGQYKDLKWNSNSKSFTSISQKYKPTLEILSSILQQQNVEITQELDNYFILVLEKTASLFWLSIMLAINPVPPNEKLREWAYIFGVVFQISDDLLDIEQDKRNGKPNICELLDVEIGRSLLVNCVDWLNSSYLEIANSRDLEFDLLAEIIGMIRNRSV